MLSTFKLFYNYLALWKPCHFSFTLNVKRMVVVLAHRHKVIKSVSDMRHYRKSTSSYKYTDSAFLKKIKTNWTNLTYIFKSTFLWSYSIACVTH
jgi:hypothetical protein